jgi:hypothetical protein
VGAHDGHGGKVHVRAGIGKDLFGHYQTILVALKKAGEVGVEKQAILFDQSAAGDPCFAQLVLSGSGEQDADIKPEHRQKIGADVAAEISARQAGVETRHGVSLRGRQVPSSFSRI